MKYSKTIILKNGVECWLRNGIESDGQAVWDCFNLTHGPVSYTHLPLRMYPLPLMTVSSCSSEEEAVPARVR